MTVRSFAPLLALALATACLSPDSSATGPGDQVLLAKGGKKPTVPGAPTNVVAAAGVRQATVTWNPPRSNGNSAILRYRVTSNPGAVTVTVNAPATTATVAGLMSGTTYSFQVVATNAVGDGPASVPSNAIVPMDTTTPPPPPPPPAGRWLSGYYVGYQRALYPESTVDFSVLTHLFVGRIRPTTSGGVVTDFDIDAVSGPAMARTLSSRAHQAGRKAVLMLGGAGEHAGFVGAASSANRATFVSNLLRTMDELGYDGIDVDWEPVLDADRAPLLALLQALRAARPGMLITIPVGWANTNFAGEIDAWYAQVAGVVDQMNLMTYDMAGPWGGWVTWHHSALAGHAGNHPSSVQGSVAAYRAAGVPAAKLGIGLGFYGSCWRGVTAPLQTIGSGAALVASDNAMSYRNIMEQYHEAGAARWDTTASVPWLTFSSPKGPQQCTFVSYENPQSVAAKGTWARTAGLGGAIVWTIAEGHIPYAAEKNPLLRAAYDALMAP